MLLILVRLKFRMFGVESSTKQISKFSEIAASVLDSLLVKREGRRQLVGVTMNHMVF